jgi:hypothetical protein
MEVGRLTRGILSLTTVIVENHLQVTLEEARGEDKTMMQMDGYLERGRID